MSFSLRYEIMRNCWGLKPNERPSFSQLVMFMYDQLMDREEKVGPSRHIYKADRCLWLTDFLSSVSFTACLSRRPTTTRTHRQTWPFPLWLNKMTARQLMNTQVILPHKGKRTNPFWRTPQQTSQSVWSSLQSEKAEQQYIKEIVTFCSFFLFKSLYWIYMCTVF